MSNQPLTDEFLTNLRETYRASQPVLDETLHEASELSKFFTAFRYMLEVMLRQSGVDYATMISWLERLQTHLDSSYGLMGALLNLAKVANAVMTEHEEEGG